MEDINLYRSKLRSPNSCKSDNNGQWQNPSSSSYMAISASSYRSFHTPNKNMNSDVLSPHKSGYFLRTPSPLKKIRGNLSPSKKNLGTPSPQKASSATDLFGNKSLLDNLEVPEDWDENFLSNFQDDWLFGFGFGNEDLENLTKSPCKSPKRSSTFLNNTPKKMTATLSPFKSPLLTSSPKFYNSSPGDKTPGGRPLTRQRKLFLQSPEHQVPQPTSAPSALPAPIPFPPMMDTSSSSVFSEGGLETSSIQSISSYLKNFDEEDHQEELPVMPPVGWTSNGKGHHVGKSVSKGSSTSTKSSKSKREKSFTMLQGSFSGNVKGRPNVTVTSQPQPVTSKKIKNEPQFTLLRPYTELHTNQISLRTTPVTPPNKIKISRDFSQIQTLPSKEQLRIVRNRFRDTLNKAVEQVIEKEKLQRVNQPATTTTTLNCVEVRHEQQQLQLPQSIPSVPQQQFTPAPIQIGNLLPHCALPQFNMAVVNVKPPSMKKRKR